MPIATLHKKTKALRKACLKRFREALFITEAELVSNKIAKAFLNLSMTWNRGFSPIFGIHIDVVPSTMPFQMAAGSHQFANEINSLQISRPISF